LADDVAAYGTRPWKHGPPFWPPEYDAGNPPPTIFPCAETLPVAPVPSINVTTTTASSYAAGADPPKVNVQSP